MGAKNWAKKDKIACIIIFTICILTFVAFFSTITLSYFYDEHSASKFIVAGEVDIVALGGPNNDGKIQFPEVLNPNTQYLVSNYSGLRYEIKNQSTSGSVYVMLKITSDYFKWIKPIIVAKSTGKYWVVAEGHSEYLYLMKPLEKGETVDLASYWQVGNIPQSIQGNAVTYTITAYAVQTQGDALKALMESNSDGWQYAPQIFKDMAGITN